MLPEHENGPMSVPEHPEDIAYMEYLRVCNMRSKVENSKLVTKYKTLDAR